MKLSPVRMGADVVSFLAYAFVDQTGVANETWTKVNFPGSPLNDSNLYDTVNSRWAPPAGKISLNAAVSFATNTLYLGTPILIAVYKNSVIFKWATGSCLSTSYAGASIAIIDTCNGSDIYDVRVYVWCSAPATVSATGSYMTYFMGTQL